MSIMHLAPDDLEELCILFRPFGGISDSECENIVRAKRGDMLFILSSFNRHFLHRNVTSEEQVAFINGEYIMPNNYFEEINKTANEVKLPKKKGKVKILVGNDHMEYNDEWQAPIDKNKQPKSLKGEN